MATRSAELSWRRNCKPEFNSQPWTTIRIESEIYWIKAHFDERLCSYNIAVTDFSQVWIENVENEECFIERAKVKITCRPNQTNNK